MQLPEFKVVKNVAVSALGVALVLNGAMNVRERLDQGYDAVAAWPQGFFPDNFADVKGLLGNFTGDDNSQPSGLSEQEQRQELRVGGVVINFAFKG